MISRSLREVLEEGIGPGNVAHVLRLIRSDVNIDDIKIWDIGGMQQLVITDRTLPPNTARLMGQNTVDINTPTGKRTT